MDPTLVLVTGASPGLGKSSLAAALVAALRTSGLHAELFREEDIRSDHAFAALMREFESTGAVQLDSLLAAAKIYLDSVRTLDLDVLVLDALFPYLPSLLAWGYRDADIAMFFARLTTVFVGFDVVELHLSGEVSNALTRAAQREGGDWLDGHLARATQFRSPRPISTIVDLVAYYEGCAERSRTLLAAAPWRVEFLDAGRGEEAVLASARAASAPIGP